MTNTKSITIGFLPLRKTSYTMKLAQGMKSILTTSQYLMGIGLMPHIPDNLILLRVKYTVQCQCQIHCSQTWCQMPPIIGTGIYNHPSQLT